MCTLTACIGSGSGAADSLAARWVMQCCRWQALCVRLSEVREDPDLGVQRCDGVGDRRVPESGGHAQGGGSPVPLGIGGVGAPAAAVKRRQVAGGGAAAGCGGADTGK